jgi:lysyl endopeptidase
MKLNLLVAIIACALLAPNAFAQINHGGTPYSWQNSKKMNQEDLHLVKLPPVNVQALQAEDAINEQLKMGPWRFGFNHTVSLNTSNSGTWTELANGDRIWRVAIKSPGALSINVEFSQFNLAEGATVFMYNEDKTDYIGSFTHENNKVTGTLGTTVVKGDKIIIEFYEPAAVRDQSTLAIGQVTHAYRSIFDYAKALGDSGSCNNNVVCPVGDNWRDQIRSVAIIVVGGNGACTGTLVNNTCSDETPYFLSANHCGTNSSNWVFRFNWESSSCASNLNGPTNQTVSGGTLRASNAGSDFALHEMSSIPPAGYGVFYSGWDNSDNNTVTASTAIHHPSGDIKKISFDNNSASKVSWGGAACWQIANWEDGTTEPGSSGSGLWDQNGRLIGQLYGGSASCSSISDDNYGRFGVSWNGSSASTRLVDWLDACNTGATTDDGYDPNAVSVPDDGATNSINNIPSILCGDQITPTITIKNSGTNNLTSLDVDYYLDANPATTVNWTGNLSSGQTDIINVPTITVGNGAHTFTATVSNPNGQTDGNPTNDTKVSNFTAITPGTQITLDIILDDYGSETTWEIQDASSTVIASGGPYSDGMDQTLESTSICIGNGCYDFILNDSYGDGICCGYGNGSYSLYDGSTTYASGGSFTFQEVTNFCITGVGIESPNKLEGITIYPNPSTGLFNINMTRLDVPTVDIKVYNTLGKLIRTEHIEGANGKLLNYDLSNLSNGLYLMEITSGEASFVQKLQINK